jgi:DNA-binding protein HU-beta
VTTKSELIAGIAEQTGKPKTLVAEILGAAADLSFGALKRGEDVVFGDFGKLSTKRREAREAHNPATGGKVQVAAKTVVKFKPSKSLSDAVA